MTGCERPCACARLMEQMGRSGAYKMNRNLGIITATTAVITLGGLALCSSAVFAVNDASTVMVIQSPIAGTLNWYTTPGVKWRGFGKVTTYPKRDQFWFSNKGDQGKNGDESLKIRFNDG